MADTVYNEGNEDKIQKDLNRAGVKSVVVLATFSNGHARANIVEKTFSDGSTQKFYNIAGTEPSVGGLWDLYDYAPVATKGKMNWEGLSKRIDQHIANIEQFNTQTGVKNKFIINGHSGGGTEGVGVASKRMDLISGINTIDSPGQEIIVTKILPNNPNAQLKAYKMITAYNANPNFVNTRNNNHEVVKIFHIRSDSHELASITEAYKRSGMREINQRFYTGGRMDAAGEHLIVHRDVFTTLEQLAREFNVPIESITRIEMVTFPVPELSFKIKPHNKKTNSFNNN
jgi:hypothetical protein